MQRYENGKRVRINTHSSDPHVANRLIRQWAEEHKRGEVPSYKTDKVTLGNLLDGVIANAEQAGCPTVRVKISCGHLLKFFGARTRARDVGEKVDSYIAHRREAGMANATIAHELASLGKAFSVAIEKKILQPSHRPHIPTLKLDNVRTGFFTAAEVEAVCAELPWYVAPVIRFLDGTGWRCGEVLGSVSKPEPLTWANVDFEHGEVRLDVGRTKNGQGRVFPFSASPSLRQLLTEQREYVRKLEVKLGRVIPFVFVRPGGSPIRDIRQCWETATRKAGLSGRLVHDLRRSFVMRAERAGVARSIATSLTGHKSETIYKRYAIADAASQREAVAKMEPASGTTPKVVPITSARRAG